MAIDGLGVDCSGRDDVWQVAVTTTGVPLAGTVTWRAPGLAEEQHPLALQRWDANGAWAEFALELLSVADPADRAPGVATALLCDDVTRAALEGRVGVSRPDDVAVEADCVTWGPGEAWPECDRL